MKLKRLLLLGFSAGLLLSACTNSSSSSSSSAPAGSSATSEATSEVTSEAETSDVTSSSEISSDEPVETSSVESSSEEERTYLENLTAESVFGTVDDYSMNPDEVKAGDRVSFRVTPRDEDYIVKQVTVNGEVVEEDASRPGYYTWTCVKGENGIIATYAVDPNPEKDYLTRFKLNLTKMEYYNLMHDSKGNYGKTDLDFREDGYELMCLPVNDASNGFMNIVDGDTTHFSTMHYGYTVKVRYLGIDTPESTSEIEEWGKSASNFSKEIFKSAKWVMLQSQAKASGIPGEDPDHPYKSGTDTNGRNLAFVWYTTVDEPKIDDWICVNLAMVANGFSNSTLSISSNGEYFYFGFDKANKRAIADKVHIHSTEKDPNYFYYDPKSPHYDGEVEQITIKDLYNTTPNYATNGLRNLNAEDPSTCSPYVDGKTLYRVEGYISRKIGYAFYIQEAPSYDQSSGLPEAYGLYVFTYSAHPFKVGDHISICGIFSVYAGTYQLQGVVYSDFNADPIRDMYFLKKPDGSKDRKNEMVPIEVTYAEFNSKNYDGVLVSITDEVYGKSKAAGAYKLEYGGSYEVDTYNLKYPFYNNSNKIVFYANSGSDTTGIRVTQDADVLIRYGIESAYSYKFYLGGELYYYPMHAEYVATPAAIKEHADDPDMMHLTYKAKRMMLTGISTNYISTSGSDKTKCHTLNITSSADVVFTGEM